MLDAEFIRDNLQAVKDNCVNRGVTADASRVVALDDERKRQETEIGSLRQKANAVAKSTGAEKDAGARQKLVAEGKALKEQVTALEKQLKQTNLDLTAALMTLPNMTHPDAPVGATSNANKVIRT